MGLARKMKHDAKERGLPTTARPTKAQIIGRTVANKFPGPPEGAEAIPTHAAAGAGLEDGGSRLGGGHGGGARGAQR